MTVTNFDQAVGKLQGFRASRKWYRRWLPRSAVAIILRKGKEGPEMLMIKRADREGDPWSGHMAFPGGRAEAIDNNSLDTAQRETREEIGLDIKHHGEYLGRLSDVLSPPRVRRKALIITPHVFTIEKLPALSINHEVAEVIWVPLRFLADEANRETMKMQLNIRTRILPCYFYQGRHIWGLSLRMLDELIAAIKR